MISLRCTPKRNRHELGRILAIVACDQRMTTVNGDRLRTGGRTTPTACRFARHQAEQWKIRIRACRADDDDLRSRLRELAQQRWWFGYRRLHILLRRDGITINPKKAQRLYREEGLTVRRRKGRRRAIGARAPAPVLALTNQRWSLDFVRDQLVTGRRFRVLNIADDVTRERAASVHGRCREMVAR